jgi:hypothetical protein
MWLLFYHALPVADICHSREGYITEAVKNANRRNEPEEQAQYRIHSIAKCTINERVNGDAENYGR